jgi:hypothetical protein
MSESFKIARACFIGSIVCTSVALLFAPIFWWLGAITGFATGYLAYEFREVLRATPIAIRAASASIATKWSALATSTKAFLAFPHPFLYFGALMALPIWSVILWKTWRIATVGGSFEVMAACSVYVMIYMFVTALLSNFLEVLGRLGAEQSERCIWIPSYIILEGKGPLFAKRIQESGYTAMELTYTNAARWIMNGVGLVILFFVWTFWVWIISGIWDLLCFLGKFLWEMFKLIHSDKRLICGIDGMLGGLIMLCVFYTYGPAELTFGEYIAVVLSGGPIGALLGLLSWEIISKRLTHFDA